MTLDDLPLWQRSWQQAVRNPMAGVGGWGSVPIVAVYEWLRGRLTRSRLDVNRMERLISSTIKGQFVQAQNVLPGYGSNLVDGSEWWAPWLKLTSGDRAAVLVPIAAAAMSQRA